MGNDGFEPLVSIWPTLSRRPTFQISLFPLFLRVLSTQNTHVPYFIRRPTAQILIVIMRAWGIAGDERGSASIQKWMNSTNDTPARLPSWHKNQRQSIERIFLFSIWFDQAFTGVCRGKSIHPSRIQPPHKPLFTLPQAGESSADSLNDIFWIRQCLTTINHILEKIEYDDSSGRQLKEWVAQYLWPMVKSTSFAHWGTPRSEIHLVWLPSPPNWVTT